MTWNVKILARAKKQLAAMPDRDRAAIIIALRRFAAESAGDVKKLKGITEEWRLRVGDYRVRFEKAPSGNPETPGMIRVLSVSQRGGAY